MSRQTFYNNFSGKHDLMAWLGACMFSIHLVKVGISVSWEMAIANILRNLCENALTLALSTSVSSGRTQFYRGCARGIRESLEWELKKRQDVEFTEDLLFQIAVFPSMLINLVDALIVEHVFPGTYKSVIVAGHEQLLPDDDTCLRFARYIVGCVPAELREAMSRPRIEARSRGTA